MGSKGLMRLSLPALKIHELRQMPTDISDLLVQLSHVVLWPLQCPLPGVPRNRMTQNGVKLEGPRIFYRSIRVFS